MTKHAMQTKTMTVTPALAAEWLERNYQSNRVIRWPRVQQLAQCIRAGHWQLTHQGIAFDTDGTLIDGQHRLYAILETGESVPMSVTTNAPTESFGVLDQGLVRQTHELTTAPWITKDVIATARAMMQGPRSSSSVLELQDKQAVLAFCEQHEQVLLDVLSRRPNGKARRGVLPAMVCGAVARAWYHCPRERLSDFMAVMTTGVVQGAGDETAIVLRDFLLGNKTSYGEVGRVGIYRKAQRAIRAFVDRETLTKLYATDDDLFPLPGEDAGRKSRKIRRIA